MKQNGRGATKNRQSGNDNGMTTTDNDDSTTSHVHAPAMALPLAATKERDLQDLQSGIEAADDPSTIGRPGAGPDTPPAGRRASTAGSEPEIMVIPSVSVWAEPESTSLSASPGGSTRAAHHSAADLVDPSIHMTQGTGAQGKTPGRRHTLSSERGSIRKQEKEQNTARFSVQISAVADPANMGYGSALDHIGLNRSRSGRRSSKDGLWIALDQSCIGLDRSRSCHRSVHDHSQIDWF